jgi:hypothetical protein
MAKECTHREYYGQFVTSWTKKTVLGSIPVGRLLRSTDEHLNDIHLDIWDRMHPAIQAGITKEMRSAGADGSLATSVCIAKASARQIMEEHNGN